MPDFNEMRKFVGKLASLVRFFKKTTCNTNITYNNYRIS